MQRAKVLAIGATLLCAAVGTAFADEPVPAGGGSGEMAPPPPSDTGGGGGGEWSQSIIDRGDVLRKGGIAAYGDLHLVRITTTTVTGMPPMTTTSTATAEGLGIGGAYGVTDKITAGLEYAFTLNSFEIKGPLTLYGGFAAYHKDKLRIGVGADLTFTLTDGGTHFLHVGAVVRYKVAPKIEVFTGDPVAPSPMGQQISFGFNNGTPFHLNLPVGVGLQAMPQLYAFFQTALMDVAIHGGSSTFIFADYIPVELGALYAVNKNIDVGAYLADNLKAAGDSIAFGLMGRYYK